MFHSAKSNLIQSNFPNFFLFVADRKLRAYMQCRYPCQLATSQAASGKISNVTQNARDSANSHTHFYNRRKTARAPAPVLAFHMSFLSFVRGSANTTRSQGLDPIFVFHFIRTNETFTLTLARQWRRIFRQHPLDISCGGRSLTPKRVFLPHNSKLIQIERVISIRGSSCDNVHARQAEAISLAGTRANRGFFFLRHATLDPARTAKTKLRHSPHAPTCYSLAIYLRLAALIAKLF